MNWVLCSRIAIGYGVAYEADSKAGLCCARMHRQGCVQCMVVTVQVCKEAEIEEIAMDSREQAQSVYITKGSEGPIVSEKRKATMAAAH